MQISLAKIQVTAVVSLSKICGDLYGDAMLEPTRKLSNMTAGNQQKHLSPSFAKNA